MIQLKWGVFFLLVFLSSLFLLTFWRFTNFVFMRKILNYIFRNKSWMCFFLRSFKICCWLNCGQNFLFFICFINDKFIHFDSFIEPEKHYKWSRKWNSHDSHCQCTLHSYSLSSFTFWNNSFAEKENGRSDKIKWFSLTGKNMPQNWFMYTVLFPLLFSLWNQNNE